jgi:hypothetical protein
MTKICKDCLAELPISSFGPAKGGYTLPRCRPCENAYRRAKKASRPKRVLTDAEREVRRARERERYRQDPEKFREQARNKAAQEGARERARKWQTENRQYMRDYYRERREKNPLSRLAHKIRCSTHYALKANGLKESHKIQRHLKCTMSEFRQHIESQFLPGMTWENYGYGAAKWNIDHIVALNTAQTEEELKALGHYSNCRPLWQVENMKKSRYDRKNKL